jgi:hypothetical protein
LACLEAREFTFQMTTKGYTRSPDDFETIRVSFLLNMM